MPDFLNTDGRHVHRVTAPEDVERHLDSQMPARYAQTAADVAPAPAEAATGFGHEDDVAPPSPLRIPRRSDGIQRGVFIWALVPVVVLLVVWLVNKVAG